MYRRPAYVPRTTPRTPSMMSEATESVRSSKQLPANINGIPEMLSFDRIINNGTCPPCTLRDFMDYLLYIEHAAEHLQFFMWFRGYIKRFESLTLGDKALSPEWTQQNQKDALDEWKKMQANIQKEKPYTTTSEVFKGSMFSKEGSTMPALVAPAGLGNDNPFVTPPTSSHGTRSEFYRTPSSNSRSATYKSFSNNNSEGSRATASTVAHDAFQNAGLNQPFTIQPFRKEIEHIIQTYVAEGSPRELNISSGQRKTLLKALEATTHPSAFTRVISDIESVLRNQLHPNFIRWTICNGNPPRVWFARGLGVSLFLVGVLVELLLTLSKAGRGYRALGAIAIVIGVATLIAGAKGMCVVLHGMHHRHLRPWELFDGAEDGKDLSDVSYHRWDSIDSIQSSNSYEDAPWIAKYEKRNIIRKVFDREIWIQEPDLRQIQDMIFIQSVLSAFAVALLITAIFVAVPKGAYI